MKKQPPRNKAHAKHNKLVTPEKLSNLLNELPEYRKQKVASINYRRNLIEAQNRDNYLNEYHRLSGYMNNYEIPALSEERINRQLENLAKKYNSSSSSTGSLYRDSLTKIMKQ